MTMYYSAMANGFYDNRLTALADMPKDAQEISDELHAQILRAQAGGKTVVARPDGLPDAVDVVASDGEKLQAMKMQAVHALEQAGRTIERVTQAVILGQTAFDAPDVQAWARYMADLRGVLQQNALVDLPVRPDYPAHT